MMMSLSHRVAAAFKSCVINKIAVSSWMLRFRSNWIVRACNVASSALVGSSAIISSGWQAITPPSRNLCSIPPLHWCGRRRSTRPGSEKPTDFSAFDRVASTFRRSTPFRCSISRSWLPTVRRGLKAIAAFCETSAMCRPLKARYSPSDANSKSTVPKLIESADIRHASGNRRSRAFATELLPQPDSPARPTIMPVSTERSTPRTASSSRPPR